MKIQIIQVPYDCGYKNLRQGLAPDYFLRNNLVRILEDDGHQAEITRIDAESEFTLEVGTAFELNRFLSNEDNPKRIFGRHAPCHGNRSLLESPGKNDTGICPRQGIKRDSGWCPGFG